MAAGTPEQMHAALLGVLAALPPATECYVGHEYTVSNLTFAGAVHALVCHMTCPALVEPDNAAVAAKLAWAQAQRAKGTDVVDVCIAQ